MNNKGTALVPNLVLVAALMLLSLAPALNAQAPVRKVGPKGTLRILQNLDNRLREIDQFLLTGNNKKAYREASLLLRRMTSIFISDSDVGRYLATATVLRAIAAYHLGREDEALWHWHVATQMFPDVLNYQMTAYGDAGPFFKDHTLPEEEPEPEDTPIHEEPEPVDTSIRVEDIKPPRRKRTPAPKIPAEKRGARVFVAVRVIIGQDGRVRQPRILASQGELTMVCATLDVLREWELEPALVDGKPVDVYYILSVNINP